MGKLQPRSFERIRSGEQIQIPTSPTSRRRSLLASRRRNIRAASSTCRRRHGFGAVSRHFGRHELAASRHWRKRHLTAAIMDKLFPIIRRKRRPLIVEDVPPIPTKNEPVQSVVTNATG
jgi:hypothetical protein